MNIQEIIRAWRDKEFRQSLSEEQLALLPENPIGETLSQEELLQISGGLKRNPSTTHTNDTTVITDDPEVCTCFPTASCCSL
jgi:mersacidin/lichenicidin family type 2 lantibiotic